MSISWHSFHVKDAIVAGEHICSFCNVHLVHQLRSRYRLYVTPEYVVRGRLHITACMAPCGLRDAFVWLCKFETIEDHVLYYDMVVSRCTS